MAVGRKVAGGAAAAGVAAAGVALAARREGASVRGWLVTHVAVPLFFGKKPGLLAFRRRIAAAREVGPALPSAKLRVRYRFTDERTDGGRVFRLAPGDGPTSSTRILYLHGGAYVFDFLAPQWVIAGALVDRTGGELVAPLYPLAPEATVEAGLAAAMASYRALVDEVGAARVVIAGDSAGGGLALALAQRLRDAGQPLPAALVLIFPWLDAACSAPEQPRIERRDPVLDLEQLREAGRMWAGESDPGAPPVSPLFGDLAGLPPAICVVGTHDVLLSDTRRFAAMRPDTEVHEYPGMFHGFICAPVPEARIALDAIGAFIGRTVA